MKGYEERHSDKNLTSPAFLLRKLLEIVPHSKEVVKQEKVGES